MFRCVGKVKVLASLFQYFGRLHIGECCLCHFIKIPQGSAIKSIFLQHISCHSGTSHVPSLIQVSYTAGLMRASARMTTSGLHLRHSVLSELRARSVENKQASLSVKTMKAFQLVEATVDSVLALFPARLCSCLFRASFFFFFPPLKLALAVVLVLKTGT